MSNIFKDFDLVKGTGMKAGIAGAGALFSGYQAVRAKVDYGNKMNEIKNYDDNRQKITNAFGQIENPYKNLAVATQAAEIKMEQTDQALANTLDTLRETGAAAGGATAIANAALKSKQGVAASIETQEVNNQKLQAQGQLQVDIAKGKGEIKRMEMQEDRDVAKLDRLQSQTDVLRSQQQSATLGAVQGLMNAGDALIGGMTAADLTDSFMDDPNKRNNAAQEESEKDFQERMENSKIDNSFGDNLTLADEIIDPSSAPVVSSQNNLQSMRNPGNMQGNMDMMKAYSANKTKLEYMQDLDILAQDETLGILDGEIVLGGINPYISGPKDKAFFDASASNNLMFSNLYE